MLCGCGAGLQAIASSFCEAARLLIGADATLLAWFSESGEPLGFFHDTAPAELKDLFIRKFDEMFYESREITTWSIVEPGSVRIGRILAPGMQEAFERTNIYRYLCVPIGHRYLLDMSASVAGIGHAGIFFWNPPDRPFNRKHVDLLVPVQLLMEQALGEQGADVRWHSLGSGASHLVVSEDGGTLLAIDADAERILMGSHLLRQNVEMLREPRQAPGFASLIAQSMTGRDHARLDLPVPDGRLHCEARRTHFFEADGATRDRILIAIELQIADPVVRIDYVCGLKLTPLQRELALFALGGHPRAASLARFDLSPEALKKHLRAVLESTGAENWDALQELGRKLTDQPVAITRFNAERLAS